MTKRIVKPAGGKKPTPSAAKDAAPKTRPTATSSTRSASRAALKVPVAPQAQAAGDMYGNQASNTGWGTTSQVNAGYYVPYRISLNYQELLFMYRGSWISRAVIDTIPEDMLKEFPTIVSEVPPEDVDAFEKAVAKTRTLQKVVEACKWGRLFGGAIAIIILAGEDQKDLAKPLEVDDIEPGSYRGLIVVDRWSGISPSSELISDIDNPAEYGLPSYYEVTTEVSQTFKVHHSRCLRFTGRDLPLFEKQIQTYWGMSELETIYEPLKRYDFVEAGIADLVSRAHVIVMKEPLLAQMLSGVGMTQQQLTDYIMRLRAVSESISTNGILPVGEDGEINAMSYTFAGLRDIHDAEMENISGASGIPMSRLGRPIAGLGNNGEGELQIYYDMCDQKRKRELRPIFDKLMRVIAMSAWGEIPADFDYRFPPIRTMSEKERGEVGKSQIDPLVAVYNLGVISDQLLLRELKRLSTENGLFALITKEMIEAADDEAHPMSDVPLVDEDGKALPAPGQQKLLGSGAKDGAPSTAAAMLDWISNKINLHRAES